MVKGTSSPHPFTRVTGEGGGEIVVHVLMFAMICTELNSFLSLLEPPVHPVFNSEILFPSADPVFFSSFEPYLYSRDTDRT